MDQTGLANKLHNLKRSKTRFILLIADGDSRATTEDTVRDIMNDPVIVYQAGCYDAYRVGNVDDLDSITLDGYEEHVKSKMPVVLLCEATSGDRAVVIDPLANRDIVQDLDRSSREKLALKIASKLQSACSNVHP